MTTRIITAEEAGAILALHVRGGTPDVREARFAATVLEQAEEIARLKREVTNHLNSATTMCEQLCDANQNAQRLSEELSLVRETARRAVAVVVPRFNVFGSITSNKRRGSIELPGGKVEPGERDWDAAKREAEEELGVAVTVHPLPLGEFLHVDQLGRAWLCTAYVGDIHGAHLGDSDEGVAGWATREELFGGAFGPVVRRILAAYDERVTGGAA